MPTFTLASFNICSAHFREGHYTEDNLRRLAVQITQSGADVVCLQEVDRGAARSDRVDMPAYLSEHTELKHRYFIKIRDFQGGEYGTAILSRYPIAAAEYHPLPSAHYEPRAFGCVTLDLGEGRTVAFLNTHLSYESAEQQSIQMAYLADWMAGHLPADIPAVLTGDFNTEDFTVFSPLTDRGYATANCADREFKTFRSHPVAIDNIVYTASLLTPADSGMVDRPVSDHNLFWCRFDIQ